MYSMRLSDYSRYVECAPYIITYSQNGYFLKSYRVKDHHNLLKILSVAFVKVNGLILL